MRWSRGKSLGQDLLRTSAANLANPLSALLAAPVLAQSLGVDGRGAVAAAIAPLVLVSTAALLGLPEATTYAVAHHAERARVILRRSLSLVVVAGVVATFAVGMAADFTSGGEPTVSRLTVLAAFAVTPALIVGVLRGLAAGLESWTRVNAEKYLTSGFRLVGVVTLAASGNLDVPAAVLIIAVAPIIGGLAYIRVLPSAPLRPQDQAGDPLATWKGLFSFGSLIWVGTLAGILASRVDQVLLAPLASLRELGLYVVAVNVMEVALMANYGVRDVIFARQAGLRADNKVAVIVARLSALFSACVALGLGATLPLWLPWLFGSEFDRAVLPAWILLLAGVSGVPGSIAGAMLSAAGRPGLRSFSMVVAVISSVTILIVLAPHLGAVGAAIATLVGNLVAANLIIFFARRVCNLRWVDFYGIRRGDLKLVISFVRSVPRGSGKSGAIDDQ